MKDIQSSAEETSSPGRTNRLEWLLFIAGLLASVVMVYILDGSYHKIDITIFLEWQKSLGHSLSDIYIECSLCNYPILGTLFSAGILELLNAPLFNLQPESHIQYYQYVLALVDGLNVLLIYLILRTLSIPGSLIWAGIIGILPSSWVGGALWGQIDGFTQFFLLAFLLHTLNYLTKTGQRGLHTHHGATRILYITGSSILMACLLLTKQLSLFSFPVLAFMVLTALYFNDRKNLLLSASGFIALTIIGVLLPDIFLALKEGYFSHVQYILFGGGSPHGNILSANGFNIWTFLDRDMESSSSRPFLSFLTPKYTGMFLFLFYEAVMFLLTLLCFRIKYLSNQSDNNHHKIFLIILYLLALTNLSFNIFLSGTHERYLYHFYPFMLIAYLGLHLTKHASEKLMLALLLAGSVFYGVFVYGILTEGKSPYLPGLLEGHRFQASFHLLLFCLLTIDYIKQLGYKLHFKTA